MPDGFRKEWRKAAFSDGWSTVMNFSSLGAALFSGGPGRRPPEASPPEAPARLPNLHLVRECACRRHGNGL